MMLRNVCFLKMMKIVITSRGGGGGDQMTKCDASNNNEDEDNAPSLHFWLVVSLDDLRCKVLQTHGGIQGGPDAIKIRLLCDGLLSSSSSSSTIILLMLLLLSYRCGTLYRERVIER